MKYIFLLLCIFSMYIYGSDDMQKKTDVQKTAPISINKKTPDRNRYLSPNNNRQYIKLSSYSPTFPALSCAYWVAQNSPLSDEDNSPHITY